MTDAPLEPCPLDEEETLMRTIRCPHCGRKIIELSEGARYAHRCRCGQIVEGKA